MGTQDKKKSFMANVALVMFSQVAVKLLGIFATQMQPADKCRNFIFGKPRFCVL